MAFSEYIEMNYTESRPLRAYVCVCMQVEVGDRHRPAFTIQCESAMME